MKGLFSEILDKEGELSEEYLERLCNDRVSFILSIMEFFKQ